MNTATAQVSHVADRPAHARLEPLAALEWRHQRSQQARAAIDAAEERTLGWAMAGLAGGWWLGGPLGAMAGMMAGALAAAWRA